MAKTAVVHSQQRWEYVSVVKRTEASLEKDLNDLGQAGWELVSVDHGKDRKGEMAWTAFLKRPAALSAQPAAEHAVASAATAQPDGEVPEAGGDNPDGFDLTGDEFSIRES